MVPYWNDECDEAVKIKEKVRKRMKHTKLLSDGNLYFEAKAKTQFVIKNTKKNHWENYCSYLNEKTKLGEIWKMTKRMSGTKSFKQISTLKEGNNVKTTNKDKANALARAFAANSSDKH